MIVKFSVAFGIALTVLAWVLAVPYSPEPVQLSMNSAAGPYRDMGILPASGSTTLSGAIGHDIFEVPADDARQLAEEMASMGMDMGASEAMTMESMETEEHVEEGSMGSMTEPEGHAEEAKDMASQPSMTMSSENAEAMEGNMENMTSMENNSSGQEEMAMGAMGDMKESEAHGEKEEAEVGHGGGSGLKIIKSANAKIDKTIKIGMDDWSYDIEHAMVNKGETVRLVITNNGNTPHEFMLMSMAGMKAVNYRIQRADWNLLEHEALFEVPIMMPGDTVEAVVEIEDSGLWMFMCMFPYHMQMGMMSMMMTPDQMGNMNMEGM